MGIFLNPRPRPAAAPVVLLPGAEKWWREAQRAEANCTAPPPPWALAPHPLSYLETPRKPPRPPGPPHSHWNPTLSKGTGWVTSLLDQMFTNLSDWVKSEHYSVFVCISRYYMYLPLEKQKPCIHVMSQWEDRTYRMYNSNMLDNIARLFVCSHASTVTETSVVCLSTFILLTDRFSFRRRVLLL